MSELSSFDIVFVLTGDPRYNSRALKQLRIFSAQGWRTHVVGLGVSGAEKLDPLFPGVSLELLPRPAGGGPAFFWKYHKLVKKALVDGGYKARLFHAGDLYNLPAVSQIARKQDAKVLFDARERYPYVASTQKRPWARLFWGGIESLYVPKADQVFTVSRSIAAHMAASYNLELPDVLYNVPEYKAPVASSVLRDELAVPAEKVLVLHQGKMQKDRGCLLLAEAMQWVDNGVLVFMGDGPLKATIQQRVTTLGLQEKVFFRDKVLPGELHAYTCSADIGVTLLEDTCLNHRYALPNKLFEYLMAGVPVLGSDLPEISNVITSHNAGRVVYPDDARKIAGVLQAMVDDKEQRQIWRKNAPGVFETFNWEKASQIIIRRYSSLF